MVASAAPQAVGSPVAPLVLLRGLRSPLAPSLCSGAAGLLRQLGEPARFAYGLAFVSPRATAALRSACAVPQAPAGLAPQVREPPSASSFALSMSPSFIHQKSSNGMKFNLSFKVHNNDAGLRKMEIIVLYIICLSNYRFTKIL